MGRKTKRQETNEKIAEKVSKMDDVRVNKLKEVFALDGTIEEACYYAEISKQTYYNWIEAKPELLDQFNALREKPILLARQTIIKSLNEPHNAQWYLTKKKRVEFGDHIDITSAGKKLAGTVVNNKLVSKMTPEEVNEFLKTKLDESTEK